MAETNFALWNTSVLIPIFACDGWNEIKLTFPPERAGFSKTRLGAAHVEVICRYRGDQTIEKRIVECFPPCVDNRAGGSLRGVVERCGDCDFGFVIIGSNRTTRERHDEKSG